ncbi:MAG: TilS substrate-binding domain-containing protein, partial [Acidimicrobiales bacterium]
AVVARQAELLADEKSLLDDLADQIDPCDVVALREQPIGLQRRVIYRWLRGSTPTDAASVARVLEVVHGRVRATQVVGGGIVRRSQGRLTIEPATSTA